jgi:hypothetical protein
MLFSETPIVQTEIKDPNKSDTGPAKNHALSIFSTRKLIFHSLVSTHLITEIARFLKMNKTRNFWKEEEDDEDDRDTIP